MSKTKLIQVSRKLFNNTVNHSIFRKSLLPMVAAIAFSLLYYSCDNKNSEGSGVPFDPSKDITITKFEPDSGHVREQVIVYGSNFGSDAENIKVFFNYVEAKVVGASKAGDKFLVLVPRLPGDQCVISVRVGGKPTADGLGYEGGKTADTENLGTYHYLVAANITTVAGDGNGQNPGVYDQGLEKAEFWPTYIAMDHQNNMFVVTDDRNLVKINVEENTISSVANWDNARIHPNASPNLQPYTDLIMFGAHDDNPRDRFTFLDPREGWAPRMRYINSWVTSPEAVKPTYVNTVTGATATYDDYALPDVGKQHNWCVWSPYPLRPDDEGKTPDKLTGWYYTLYEDGGTLVRVDPATWEATIVGLVPSGTTYSAAIHPLRMYELWIGAGSEANASNGFVRGINGDEPPTVMGSWNNSICVVDLRDLSFNPNINTITGVQTRGLLLSGRKLSSSVTSGTWKDGPIYQAEFNRIRQVNFDPDGNLFVGDCENACLRQIATMADPMMVTTVIGIPGKKGFQDGSPDEALFRQLHGVVSDKDGTLFVTDWNNGRVRRVAVE